MRKNKFFRKTKIVFAIMALCHFSYTNLFCQSSIVVYPSEIYFNYDVNSNAEDATTIATGAGVTIVAPEWKYYVHNNSSAFVCNQTNRKIKVLFNMNCEQAQLTINLTVNYGTAIGILTNYVIPCYNKNTMVILPLEGTVPSTIGKYSFSWRWEIYATPITPGYRATNYVHYSSGITYYTILNSPVSPSIIPRTNILDYACAWANGQNNAESVCTCIMNSINANYSWNYNCHRLSSDFVRLVTSLGIQATLHKWSSNRYEPVLNHMWVQRTKPFDPVGPKINGTYDWVWHQWAEANGSQRDPSAYKSIAGSWGDYEDYCFLQYEQVIGVNSYQWQNNQSGQSIGCEALQNRIYEAGFFNLESWMGPNK